MAEVVLFHHAQGLTSGVVAFADELRRAGHTVHTPDLLDGRPCRRGPARRAGVRGLLARRAPGPDAGADPAGRAGRAAVLLLRAGLGVRPRLARGGPGTDPRHGRRPDLRRRG